MAGLVPAIHVSCSKMPLRLSYPAQWHVLGPAKPDPSAGHDELHHRASFYWLLFESDSQSRISSVCREIEADGEGLNKAHRRDQCAQRRLRHVLDLEHNRRALDDRAQKTVGNRDRRNPSRHKLGK